MLLTINGVRYQVYHTMQATPVLIPLLDSEEYWGFDSD